MAEPFKNLINAETVRNTRKHLSRAWPAFDGKRFEKLATTGLDALELKARVQHLRSALEATLPKTFSDAAEVIEASLASMQGSTNDEGTPQASADGLAGWAVWPLADYVAHCGLADPRRALAALHALTQRSTAEFSIRPFIEHHPERAFDTLMQWTTDPSPHVRRLVSEGSRPRLPWGAQLKGLMADPSPTFALLQALQDDPSAYVRRSVANHLNDIAKDHPALLAQWLEQHLPEAPAERRALLKHASRTLIKKGDARVLKAWGLGQRFKGEVALALSHRKLAIGDSLTLTATLQSSSARAQKLVVDYAVHHLKANGQTTPKVFKGWTLELAPHVTRVLSKRHSLRVITTRQYHAGQHAIDIRVNGETLAERAFVLQSG
jgi:3-methyladenine DNA glycosylase AlkC